MKRFLCSLLFLSCPLYAAGVDVWDSLLPLAERQQQEAVVDHSLPMGESVQQNRDVSLNDELNGTEIRIPGFVVPLEGDEKRVTEFLLVPYFGACLHYPPPPPNQIVYVIAEKGVPVADLWEPIWVEGIIQTEIKDIDGEFLVGYKIVNPKSIEIYSE